MKAKLICNELYKLFHAKIFIFVFVCVLALNLYIAFSQDLGNLFSDSDYKAYFRSTENMSLDEARAYTEAEIENTEIALNGRYDADLWWKGKMLSERLTELETVMGYDEYLSSIDTAAKMMTSVSIFADKESFSYRNIVKTPSAYDPVRSVTPAFESSLGILLAAENTPSDLLLIFIIVTAVTFIFYKDRESGITALIKPLKSGRATLALSKTTVSFIVCLLAQTIIFASNLIAGEMRFGLGDLSRPVQSLSGYIGCNLPVSVSEFLALTFLFKLSAVFLIALIAQCFLIRLSNTVAYIVLIAIAAVEMALYSIIDTSSAFSIFRHINLAAFVKSADLFVTYTNINIFGYPADLICCTITALVLFTLLCLFLALKLFSGISISEIRRDAKIKFKTHVPKTLFPYTVYKAFVMHKAVIISVVVLIISINSALDYSKPYDPDDSYYYKYCNEIVGTDETVAEFIERASLFEGVPSDNISYAMGGLERFKAQYAHVELLNAEDDKALMYYQTGYKEMLGVGEKAIRHDYSLGIIAVAALCLMIAPLIAYDNRARIGYLLYTTKSGKRSYLRHKILVSVIIAVIVSAFVYIPYFISVLDTYGTQGMTESIRAIAVYGNMPDFPVWSYMALLFAYRTVILILTGWLILFISAKSKSPAAAIIVSLAIFALPILVNLAGAEFIRGICIPISGNREVQWLLG